MNKYLLLSVLLLTGCASSGLNGLCGRITTQDSTLPYVGGKGNVDGFACHIGCVGANCKPIDPTVLSTIMTKYLDLQTTSGKIITNTPGTVTFTPSKT